MRKNIHKLLLKALTNLSVSVAKTTVCSTTRYGMYQPEDDYKVYLQMKKKGLI